jgi:UrcA family protein
MNTTIQKTVRAATLFLCGAITLCAVQATARADDGLRTQRVSYADLNISKPAGAKVLYSRIVKAAYRVCEDTGFKNLAGYQRQSACVNRAIADAVKQVDSPALSALRTPGVLRLASN